MKPIIAGMIGAAFGDTGTRPLPVPVPGRRRKLWEITAQRHCPLIGTCLPVAEMRRLAVRAGYEVREMSDYSLHATAVSRCDTRNELSEQIQRWLDKRHMAAVARFGRLRDPAAVMLAWREALAAGDDIAGALWATWTHADVDEDDGKEIYGDIHMLSHQIGASARADLRRLETLRHDNAVLGREVLDLRRTLIQVRQGKDSALADVGRRLADAEQRAAMLPRRELDLAEARKAAGQARSVLDRAEALAARVERLEERNGTLARNAEGLARELNEAQDKLAASEAALQSALGICEDVAGSAGCGRSCPAEAELAGRCVLCIGGRTGLVDGYRRLVETRGGRFLHHDGGIEESLHRIDGAIAAADAVVCQAGCISHAAYFRLKEACKKLGKPCVFVKSPGVGSFARGLAVLGGADAGQARVGLLAH